MFLNGETNCQPAKESLGEKYWFSPHESCFVELDKEVNNIQEGRSYNCRQVHGFGRGLGSRCYHPFCQFNHMLSARTNSRPSALVSCNPLTKAKGVNPSNWKQFCFHVWIWGLQADRTHLTLKVGWIKDNRLYTWAISPPPPWKCVIQTKMKLLGCIANKYTNIPSGNFFMKALISLQQGI